MKSKKIRSISDAVLQTALAIGAGIVAGVLVAQLYNQELSRPTWQGLAGIPHMGSRQAQRAIQTRWSSSGPPPMG